MRMGTSPTAGWCQVRICARYAGDAPRRGLRTLRGSGRLAHVTPDFVKQMTNYSAHQVWARLGGRCSMRLTPMGSSVLSCSVGRLGGIGSDRNTSTEYGCRPHAPRSMVRLGGRRTAAARPQGAAREACLSARRAPPPLARVRPSVLSCLRLQSGDCDSAMAWHFTSSHSQVLVAPPESHIVCVCV